MTQEFEFHEDGTTQSPKQYVVRIRTQRGEYEGVLFSPDPTKRLAEALVRMDGFVNLKDARDISSREKFPFMVISKEHIETIKVLDER